VDIAQRLYARGKSKQEESGRDRLAKAKTPEMVTLGRGTGRDEKASAVWKESDPFNTPRSTLQVNEGNAQKGPDETKKKNCNTKKKKPTPLSGETEPSERWKRTTEEPTLEAALQTACRLRLAQKHWATTVKKKKRTNLWLAAREIGNRARLRKKNHRTRSADHVVAGSN